MLAAFRASERVALGCVGAELAATVRLLAFRTTAARAQRIEFLCDACDACDACGASVPRWRGASLP